MNSNRTDKWRYVVELSSMQNNWEMVFFHTTDLTAEQFNASELPRLLKQSSPDFSKPRLVICRPVLEQEIVDGLDTAFFGGTPGEKEERPPRLTMLLDGLWKVAREIEWGMKSFREDCRTPSKILAHIIAYQFYDCMSGGMPMGCILGCRYLIKKHDCDLSELVYPGKNYEARRLDDNVEDEWYTLGDWMEETKQYAEDMSLDSGEVTSMLEAMNHA